MREYWHIDQSQGDVFALPLLMENGRTFNAVGSTGCRSCVCVFVELSSTTCFAAHISAIDHAADCAAGERKPATVEQRIEDNRARIVPDETQAKQLVEMVVQNLCDTASLLDLAIEGKFSGIVGQTLIVCPMRIWVGERATGSFIIQALEQFLGVKMTCKPGQGFIVEAGLKEWSLQVVGWKGGYPGPLESDTDFYNAAKHEEESEKYGWTRTNAWKEPPIGGRWAFDFAKAGMWVHFCDRD